MTEDEIWLQAAIVRTQNALKASVSAADRLALLRELARLGNGHLSLVETNIVLSPEERSLLPRFRLLEAGGGTSLLLASLDGFPWAREIALDTSSRRLYSPAVADAVLLRLSPHTNYQTETQKAAVRALITMPPASTLIVSMPTGSGKSLLFELAPKWWADDGRQTSVIVIVPTIALALDHERTLAGYPGLEKSRALTSQLSSTEREEVLFAFRRGEVPVLLLSPEMAMGRARRDLLETALPPDQKAPELAARLSAVFVDEAHIIESWGRTFRPEFQRLPALVAELRSNNPDLRVILLSATLNSAARKELKRAYESPDRLEITAGVPRYELDLVVQPVPSKFERDRLILAAVDHVPRPAILYTSEVDHARELYEELHDVRGYRRIALFTGEIDSTSERRRIIDSWANNSLDLVVATSAFGMGIDKRDVRAILHACLPESASRYYQEIGRAARDGHQGLAIAIWFRSANGERDDEEFAFGQATRQWLTQEKSEARWAAIVKHLSGQEGDLWDEATHKRRLRIRLDAAHDGIARGPNDYNERWNMGLLNLMQRAGAITIQATEDTSEGPVWPVLVERPELIAASERLQPLWNEIFRLREQEKAEVTAEFNAFRDLLKGRDVQCVLQGIFELIDSESDVEPCGRCPACRAAEIPPPTEVKFGGLDRVWRTPPISGRCKLPAGITLFHPSDTDFAKGLPRLFKRLVSIGIDQFIVPNGLGAKAAEILVSTGARTGLVLEWHSILSAAEPIDIPSAALLPPTGSIVPYVEFLQAWTDTHPQQSVAVFAAPGRWLLGRPLEQIISRRAPYDEEHLDRLLIRGVLQ